MILLLKRPLFTLKCVDSINVQTNESYWRKGGQALKENMHCRLYFVTKLLSDKTDSQ